MAGTAFMSSEDAALTLAELESLAADLANQIKEPATLGLVGVLGAGKSTFARSFLRALGVRGDIPSPTFTLAEVYEGVGPNGIDVWHVDAYRLTTPDEAEALGLLNALGTALCLIEWPDKLGAYLPRNTLNVAISMDDDPNRRRVKVMGFPT